MFGAGIPCVRSELRAVPPGTGDGRGKRASSSRGVSNSRSNFVRSLTAERRARYWQPFVPV